MNYKGYLINQSKLAPNLYSVSVEGRGGKIPNILEGLYTKRSLAKTDIDKYLESKDRDNAKERGKGGSQ